jgi:hypothetical protein
MSITKNMLLSLLIFMVLLFMLSDWADIVAYWGVHDRMERTFQDFIVMFPHMEFLGPSLRILVCSPHLFNLLLHSKMLMAVSALSTEYRVVLSMVITLSTEYSEYIEY